ncbi:ribosomal large subunit pseudouridine synthase B [Bacteroides sp. 3_1_23]|nr:ribosomal large subunit pseudouridine synthase B [Bacteroides sp. 3_1_23]
MVLMIVLNVLPTTVKVVLMTVLNVPVSIAAKVVIVLNVLLTTVKVATVLTVPALITAKVATVLNVLLTTVKVVTVRIVPVLITAKVAAIAAITAVGEVTVRDTTMTVHKEAIVLVRVPAIMIRMLSIA